MKKHTLLVLTLILMLAITACGNSGNNANSGNSASGNNAGGSKSELSGSILATGSSALQPLVEQASISFMDKNTKVSVLVQGGGSGTGLTQVSQGQADIGNSDVFASEKLEADVAAKLIDHRVAVVAMATVVNPDLNIDDLTQQQLIDIFTGKITNWKDVNGPDQKIQIINRPASSGTRATFEKYALGTKSGDVPGSIQEDSSGTVRKLVSETPGAIGYLAFSYLNDSVKAVKYNGVDPTIANVVTGEYPVWAYEHMYTDGEPNEIVKAFLDYMMTDEVQQGYVVELGYIPVSDMKIDRDEEGNVTSK